MNQVSIISQAQADELYRRLPKRSKFIFALGIETGLRVSDILRLKIGDIENPMSVYVGRINAVRAYKLSEWLYTQLLDYANLRPSQHYIFTSRRKYQRHLHRTTYHRDIKQAVAGLDFSASAHSTRKFFLQLISDK